MFHGYGATSGQIINPGKSTFYSGSVSYRRQAAIAEILGFAIGKLPFVYLGIPIFKGKPRACHLQPIADRIKAKLAAWKPSLLSIAGRVQLVKTVIYGMMLYSFLVYTWPISLLKTVDRWIKNFIWSGDVNYKKVCTASWHKVCFPLNEGGLGLRSLKDINNAAALKLCWDFLHSNEKWACLLRARVLRNGCPILYCLGSSIWSGIKHKYGDAINNVVWQLGNGYRISFWTDHWLVEPLVSLLQIPANLHKFLATKVKDFIYDGEWRMPSRLLQMFPDIDTALQGVIIPAVPCEDLIRWKNSDSGELAFKEAYLHYRPCGQAVSWAKLIWSSTIPPSKSFLVWRILQDRLPTDDKLRSRGCFIVSMCCLCSNNFETTQHLFCDYPLLRRSGIG